MLSDRLGVLLENARKQLDLSRDELALRGDVRTRLVAELERGQRPNEGKARCGGVADPEEGCGRRAKAQRTNVTTQR